MLENFHGGTDPVQQIVREIRRFCGTRANNMGPEHPEPSWAEPLIGFARGDDPVFDEFKTAVGAFHWTPLEAFSTAFPATTVQAHELAVVVWVLPQTSATKTDNTAQTRLPSERWARSRIFGEIFNVSLRRMVAEKLTGAGYQACVPTELPGYGTVDSQRYFRASTWSERHMAYAAGLGTFGLCDGLITPVGKAMRVGSVLARMPVEPAERPYSDHRAYCLYYARGTCGECIPRCPAGALSHEGHEKSRCSAFLDTTRSHVEEEFGFQGYGCGLCQTGVPCESGIPAGITSDSG
jgi:ferredoxin